ncbi:sulfotransferase 1C2-like [Lineus longissimus]|uniref:sulfotransferase 1C2-like n=1 Tax=Lineus longissimus TaxID=88925 RepID=UPI002B4C690D
MSQINSLPDGNAYKVPGQYIYEGIVMGQYTPRHHLDNVKAMEIVPDDVIVSAYPKSGTTMLCEIVWLILHDANVAEANKCQARERIPFIEYVFSDNDDGLVNARNTPRPRLLKTHLQRRLLPLAVKPMNIKQISILRNPKDVLVSNYYFYKSTVTFGRFTGDWDEFFEMFMADNIYWGNVLDHVLEWWESRQLPNVMVLFYEDILRKPSTEIGKVSKFLGKELSAKDIDNIALATSFKTMKSNPMTNAESCPDEVDCTISPFMRKGTVGDWKNHFSVDQSRRMDEIIKRKLGGVEINYQYEL